MKMKVETNKEKKTDGRLKYFCGQEGVYKIRVESLCNGYQTTSAHERGHMNGAIKLALAGTQDWWHRFPPMLGY